MGKLAISDRDKRTQTLLRNAVLVIPHGATERLDEPDALPNVMSTEAATPVRREGLRCRRMTAPTLEAAPRRSDAEPPIGFDVRPSERSLTLMFKVPTRALAPRSRSVAHGDASLSNG